MSLRHDGRHQGELRRMEIVKNPLLSPLGSILMKNGNTKVLCTVTIEEIKMSATEKTNEDHLYLTSHFIPVSGNKKVKEEEILFFVKKSLQNILDFTNFPFQIRGHLEVFEGDGSVASTALNGMYMALRMAIRGFLQENSAYTNPIKTYLGSVRCGILTNGDVAIDLDQLEEDGALVIGDIVMTEEGEFLEINISGHTAFTGDVLNGLLFRGKNGIEEVIHFEKEHLFDTLKVEKEMLVIATKNQGKAKEFERIFEPLGFKVKTLLDFPEIEDIPETGQTFEENAKIKAEALSSILNQAVLADDSGLKVDALNGLPGIYSARFAGPQKSDASNNAKLLAELAEVPKEKRKGQFYCALAVAAPHKETLTVHGIWEGEIASLPAGENGFGYDSLFYIPSLQKTAAQLTNEEKNQLSHRSLAVKELIKEWPNWWGEKK